MRHPASSIFPTSNKVKLRFHGCIESRCSASFLKTMESQICHLHLKQIPCSRELALGLGVPSWSSAALRPCGPCGQIALTCNVLSCRYFNISRGDIWNSCQQQKELFHVGLPAERPNLVSTLNFLLIIWTDLLILSHDICPESTAENGSTL